MPDDVGGQPFPDGERPDSADSGAADEAFAAVVLDEAFIRAAAIHEPTAADRMLRAALERAERADSPEEPFGFYQAPELDPGAVDGAAGSRGWEPTSRYDGYDRFGIPGYQYREYREDRDFGEEGPPGQAAPVGRNGLPGSGSPADTRPDASGPAGFAVGRRPSVPASWRPARWQRPVACVLAVVMGISMVAFALVAVQRAGSAQRPDTGPVSPASEPGDSGGGSGGDRPAGSS
ncbi:hypothetical protein PJ985_11475 [Streptomyces sp. ACA25]|uniref:SCO2584 family spore wall biosynthesis protein n=1 Tax=Streptomyces sp. ACA25 TaxID=3022596 RepID=UPI0023070A81|nr:hypothetical protein [Streptomyces sp. ACA25]MDB1088184.1 hypothetical protein [Streptomyces sp. ACA25]